jgi:protein-serine/threonine kinase
MKIFNKNNLEKNKLIKNFTTELNMQKQLIFPFCLSINHSVEIGNSLYLTSEYCSGNNLTFYKNRKLFEENSIKLYIAEIILTIEYLHKLEYSCKSLSLENILIAGDNHIKLANLKLNKIEFTYEDGNKICSGVGEDIYSIGCILYELISGIPPLFITNLNFITKKKEEELFLFDYFSDNLKDLLSKLLGKEPKKRIGFKNKKELKNHPWFKNINWDNLLIKCSNPSINFSLIKKEIEESFHNS